MAILGVRISPMPTLWLVSADERLGPDNVQIRCHIESQDQSRLFYVHIEAGEASLALTN